MNMWINKFIERLFNTNIKHTKLQINNIYVDADLINKNDFKLRPQNNRMLEQYKNKTSEFLELCEYGINNKHYKSTVYFNLLFAIELMLKRQLMIRNIDYDKSHKINDLSNQLDANEYTNVIEKCEELLKRENQTFEKIADLKYNYTYNKGENIVTKYEVVIKNDVLDSSAINFIKEIIKCIKKIEIE